MTTKERNNYLLFSIKVKKILLEFLFMKIGRYFVKLSAIKQNFEKQGMTVLNHLMTFIILINYYFWLCLVFTVVRAFL